ncbi:hypothetical protein D3C76_1474780 [compost metagenome]
MIAQYTDQSVAYRIQEAQGGQRFRATIHKIANQPEAILRRIEMYALQQAFEWLQATLQVADCIHRH